MLLSFPRVIFSTLTLTWLLASSAMAVPTEDAAGGSIGIFFAETPEQVDLAREAPDWAKWGPAANQKKLARQSSTKSLISNYTTLGEAAIEGYEDSKVSYSWTGSSPFDAETEHETGIRSSHKGSGFSFVLPADQSWRTFKLYAGGWDSQAELSAVLSDGSAAPYTILQTHPASGDTNTTYAISYRAAAASQTLKVSWKMIAGGGECTLQAASLKSGEMKENLSGFLPLKRGSVGTQITFQQQPCPTRHAEAKSLFDGKSLAGWEGDPKIWRVEEGVIMGGSLEQVMPRNEFLASIKEYHNFILHFKIKMVGKDGMVNSGLQIRSQRVPNDREMSGYQCDYGDPTWWGSIYDESRRNKLMAQSDMAALEPVLRRNDWNEYVICAEGRHISTWINGVQGVNFTEADSSIIQSGRLGLQVHGGGKLTVQVKDITILELPEELDGANDKKESQSDAEPASRKVGMTIKPFSKSPQVQNGVALTVDDAGKVYVCETYRFGNGAEDNREHSDWIMEDLAIQTLDQRKAMLTKYAANLKPGYFTEYADRVVRLVDADGDGKADIANEFAGNFRDMVEGPAAGIAHGLLDGKEIYLANSPRLWKLKDSDGDGTAESREVMVEGLGIRTCLLGHDLHGLTWGPDGLLYFSLGDRGFHFTTKEGAVLSNPDGGGVFRSQPDGSEIEQVYHGLRNPQEMAFNELGDLFTVDNNADQGDQARIHWLIEGGDSGWHVGHQSLTTHKKHINEGGYNQPPHWLSENLWKTAHRGQPLWIVPPIQNFTTGPSGMVFTSGLSLPSRYQNSFFITDYIGSPNQCSLWNFKVAWKGSGYTAVDEHLFHKGIANSDVDFGPDGKLYLLDFGGGWAPSGQGAVYTMAWPEGMARPDVKKTETLLKEGFVQRAVPDLIALLGHPDQRVRLRASVALAARGTAVTTNVAEATAKASGVARWHGLWTLGQLRAMAAVRPFLADRDAETRAQAARTAGQLKDPAAVDDLILLLKDPSPRVRIFAALALGRIKDPSAFQPVLAMITQQGTQGAFLRHAAVMALLGTASKAELTALANHPEAAVRLCAVLALRRLRDQGVGRFLADSEPSIAAEALRAIADVPIPTAFPDLRLAAARLLEKEAPEWLTNAPSLNRVLRSLLAEGTAPAAQLLAHLAATEALGETSQLLALRTLKHFVHPPPVDFTTGLWRPLQERDPAFIRLAVTDSLTQLLNHSENEIMASALTVSLSLGITSDPEKLVGWAADERQSEALRLAALAQLTPERVISFTADHTAAIRAAASRQAAGGFPDKAAGWATSLIARGTATDLQAAYEILTVAPGAASAATLESELSRLQQGTIPEAQRLDLIEAASARKEPAILEKVAAYEASLVAQGKSLLHLALIGGNPQNGKQIFANQGTCLKCHQAEGQGGIAGPNLAGLALRCPPEKIFESVINPNAVITAGYGLCVFTLADQSVVAGTITSESPSQITINTPEGETRQLTRRNIQEQTPAISPMPPVALGLSRRDLRDLFSYLTSLNTPPVALK